MRKSDVTELKNLISMELNGPDPKIYKPRTGSAISAWLADHALEIRSALENRIEIFDALQNAVRQLKHKQPCSCLPCGTLRAPCWPHPEKN